MSYQNRFQNFSDDFIKEVQNRFEKERYPLEVSCDLAMMTVKCAYPHVEAGSCAAACQRMDVDLPLDSRWP